MHAPTGIRTEVLLRDGTWEDISTRVRRDGGQGIRLTQRGRRDERGRSTTSMNLTLEDSDGDFNELNPLSPYYGLIGPNTQLRVSLGSSASKSDDFNRSVSNAWTGGSFTWTNSGGTVPDDYDIDGTYGTQTHPSANVLHYSTMDMGQANHRVRTVFKLSAATLTGGPVSAWLLARFTDTSNYYAAHVECQTDGDVHLSIYRRVAGTLTLLATADAPFDNSSNFSTDQFAVEFYVEGPKLYAKAWDITTPEPTGWTVRDTDDFLTTGNRAGLASRRESTNTNASLAFMFNEYLGVPGTIRAHVEVPNFGAYRWTHGAKDVTMSVQGADIVRRLGTGAKSLRSPMYREITRANPTSLVGYWPLEEGAKSTQIASGLPGALPMNIVGTDISFGGASPFAGTTSLVTLGAGVQLRANVLSGTDTGEIKARLILDLPTSEPADLTPIIEVSQVKDATVRKWRLLYLTGGGVRLVGYTHAGAVAEDTGPQTGATVGGTWWIGFELTQNGANVDWEIDISEPTTDGSASTGGVSGTFAGSSVGGISGAVIAPTGGLNGCAVGQFALADDTAALAIQDSSLIAHHGETSTERFGRLCAEEGIAYEVVGFESSVSSVQMGPQRVATLLQVLQDCEDAEHGFLYGARHFFGLVLRTHETLYNQTGPGFPYDDGFLTGEPFPAPDEVLRANDVTAALPSGAEFQSVEEGGPMSILDPPDGIGRYDRRVPVLVRNAVDLPDIARFNRHLGTWQGPRYPAITFDTHRPVFTQAISDDVDELDIGDYFSVSSQPAFLAPGDIEVLTPGYTERIENMTRTITFNTVPAGPYFIAERGTAIRDSLASTLNASALANATSLSVAVTGPLWTTGAVDFDVMISGSLKHVTNISGASSPQTFTVSTNAVNGINKALAAGDEVHVYPAPVRGLTSVNFNSSVPSDAVGDLVVGRDTPPAVWVEGESTGTFTGTQFAEDTEPVGVTFRVPSSGAVLVYLAGELENDTVSGFTLMGFTVRSTSEIGGGTERLAPSDSNALLVLGTDNIRSAKMVRLDGSNVASFLAGREYNIVLCHRRVTGGNSSIRRRMLLVVPDKVQGGLPGSVIGAEPASASDVEDTSDTSTSTAYTTADMNVCGMSFVAPPSGKVKLHLSARMDNSGASSCFISYRVGTAGVVGAGTEVVAPDDTRALEQFQVNQITVGASFPVTGLTAGDTYNVQMMHRASAGTITLENRHISVHPVA
jgi:hypothetical protein